MIKNGKCRLSLKRQGPSRRKSINEGQRASRPYEVNERQGTQRAGFPGDWVERKEGLGEECKKRRTTDWGLFGKSAKHWNTLPTTN